MGYNHSPETRAKISAAHLGKPSPFKGKHHTAGALAKMSAASCGRVVSPEIRAKISAAMRGQKHTLGLKLGPCSAERKAKISAANKGRRATAESRAINSISHMGRPGTMKGKHHSPEARAKMSAAKIGKIPTKETREKMRLAMLGSLNPFYGKRHTDEAKEKMRPMLGKRQSEETRKKMSLAHGRGEQNRLWRGGPVDGRHRWETFATVAWRLAVYARDDYTCQYCSERGIFLNAHHIKSWVKYPELRFEVSNGITLCLSCHKNLHWGRGCKILAS